MRGKNLKMRWKNMVNEMKKTKQKERRRWWWRRKWRRNTVKGDE